MGNVSRPLIALLVGSVLLLGIWLVALKSNSPATGGGKAPGVGQFQPAIDKARQAVTTSNAASQAHGGTVTPTPTTAANPAQPTGSTPTASTPSATAATATTGAQSASGVPTAKTQTPVDRQQTVAQALAQHKVLAMLFYNPAATDDRAVKQELDAVPAHAGSVIKLAVPIDELSSYGIVANQVSVNFSPTLVLIDRAQHATEIAGFADRFEIEQRIGDALAAG